MPLPGKLVLKGGGPLGEKKKKKRKRDGEERAQQEGDASKTAGEEVGEGRSDDKKQAEEEPDDGLTPAQRRHLKKLEERDIKNIKSMVSKSHRERVEEFNSYLSSLTEHNDIPRVSAAGNG